MDSLLRRFYRGLLVLSGVFMVATFLIIVLGIVSRLAGFNLPGLDAYAGYSIAAALFLALPATLEQGDHIRVTLVLERLSPRIRRFVEWWCLGAASALVLYLAWYSVRFVWVSYTLEDVSTSADMTPLWIPQLLMAVGCAGFAVAFLHAVALRLKGKDLIQATQEGARVE